MAKKLLIIAIFALCLTSAGSVSAEKKVSILNVSYDSTRELYAEINKSFKNYWLNKAGQEIDIKLSNGGSGKQARSVIDGLGADLVTLALSYDIDKIAFATNLISPDWQKKLPYNSSPFNSTVIFLVRKGNPKHIKDWDDLTRNGIRVITPNPKTSGGARWNYLAAYAYALIKYQGSDQEARQFVSKLYKNVPVLDTSARGSTTTFIKRQVGDVLITWENEAYTALQKFREEDLITITPSVSILAEPAVALVEKNAASKGTEKISQAYLDFLYSDDAQRIAGRNFYRPSNPEIMAEFSGQFQKLRLVSIYDTFGGWQQAQKTHFSDGGLFDQIYSGN